MPGVSYLEEPGTTQLPRVATGAPSSERGSGPRGPVRRIDDTDLWSAVSDQHLQSAAVVLDGRGVPRARGGDAAAPGLRFIGYVPRPGGLGYMAKETKQAARAIVGELRKRARLAQLRLAG